MAVVIETTAGDITVDLYTKERPTTCMNFLKLCKAKYYNLNLLFSVERNFIAQTGDPTGTGRGGESMFKQLYGDQAKFYEGEKLPVIKHKKLGTVSMVSCGSHLFGSQFFVMLGENLDSLDDEHLVFGEVVEGFEVLDHFNQMLVDEKNRPYQDVYIIHTVVLEDPFPDPEGLHFPDRSPVPTEEMLESDYIRVDENIDDTEGKTMEEIQEDIASKDAEARATILEMVGDIPDVDIAPPENVLFVCKLNPVTTADDIEIIFSRFGKVKSCEVIHDRVTGNSLQYAFVEFTDKKACEDAYFKMDNVLIDDRRIHVDFSQSVSRIRWKGKGRGVEYYDDDGNILAGKEAKNFSPHRDSLFDSKNKCFNSSGEGEKTYDKQRHSGGRKRERNENCHENLESSRFHSSGSKADSDEYDKKICHMQSSSKSHGCRELIIRTHHQVDSEVADLVENSRTREKMVQQLRKELGEGSTSGTSDSDSSRKVRKKTYKKMKKKTRYKSEESDLDTDKNKNKYSRTGTESDVESRKKKKKRKRGHTSSKRKHKSSLNGESDSEPRKKKKKKKHLSESPSGEDSRRKKKKTKKSKKQKRSSSNVRD